MNQISFTLEPDSKIRLYHQLYEKISELIKNGSYAPHSKLPSIRTISTKLKVSKNTVTKAYEMLEKNRFIYSEEKKGYFVNSLSAIGTEEEIKTVVQEETQEEEFIPTVESILKNHKATIEIPDEKAIEIIAETIPVTTNNKENIDSKEQTVPKKTNSVTISPEKRLAECFSKTLQKNTLALTNKPQPFGELCLKTAIADFLSKNCGMDTDPNQIVIASSIDSLLSSVLNLQSLNTPYIKSNGVGLLKLANQFSSGSLTTVKAVTAIAEDTDFSIKKIFTNTPLPYQEVPTDEFGISSNFIITSGATSVLIVPSKKPDISVTSPDEYKKVILDWTDLAPYRYIIEYDESVPSEDSFIRFKPSDKNDKVIYINSFENLIPFGINTAFAVLPKKIYADFQQRYDNFSCPVSLLEQLALTEFINNGYLTDYISNNKAE